MRTALASALASSLALCGCGQRADFWSHRPDPTTVAVASSSSVALIDTPAERVVLFSADGELSLTPTYVPIGRVPVATASTPDGKRIVVLTRGDVPRRTASDQAPALWVLGGATGPGLEHRYELSDPLSGLELDPESRFAIVHATDADASFVEYPNELVVIVLTQPPGP